MSPRSILLFLALGVFWGIPYALIKISVGELDPLMLCFARTAIAAIVLIPIALVRKDRIDLRRQWKPLLAYTVAEIVVPWFFLNTAETKLPSSTPGLMLASIPLVSLAIGVLFGRRERLSPLNWVGILISTIGVVSIVGVNVAGSDPASVAAVGIVVLGYAVGPMVLSRWMPGASGVAVAAASMAVAAVVYGPLTFATGSWPDRWPSTPVILSVLILAIVCSAAAFILLVHLTSVMGPMRVTTVTYLNPVVAVLTGIVLLREQLTIGAVLGFVLVTAGAILFGRRAARVAPLTPVEAGTAR
ncbi:DMT family transporter [Naasia lichenicola]|uniref:DMT family transporter n=1 Tax=Naasia lichenicola TaxID=2565933 RepID=UPI00130E9465|nr:EamA family transporter [Naasia lichenicola]